MTKKINILLVDDSKPIMSALQVLFSEEKNNRTIITANSIAQAQNILDTGSIDIAVLDIHLPDGNGLELLKTIKKQSPYVDVMMLSNNSAEPNRIFAKNEGANFFFDKTLEFEDAAKTLTELVNEKITSTILTHENRIVKTNTDKNIYISSEHCFAMVVGSDLTDNYVKSKMLRTNGFAESTISFRNGLKSIKFLKRAALEGDESAIPDYLFYDAGSQITKCECFLEAFFELPDSVKNKTKIIVISELKDRNQITHLLSLPCIFAHTNCPLLKTKIEHLKSMLHQSAFHF